MLSLMKRLSGTKISTRLAVGFSILLALLVLLTAAGILQVNQIDRGLTQINDVHGEKQGYAVDMRGSVHDRAITLRDIVITAGDGMLSDLQGDMRRLEDAYQVATSGMEQINQNTTASAEEQRLLSLIAEQANTATNLTEQVLTAREASSNVQAQALLLEQAGPAYTEWLNRINQFIDLQERINYAITADARATASGFQLQMLGLTLFALLIGGLIAVFLSRQLLRELGAEPYEVKAFAQAIGRGELTTKGRLKKGDKRSIMASQVEMAKHLQDIVAQVRASAEAVASNSEQRPSRNGFGYGRIE